MSWMTLLCTTRHGFLQVLGIDHTETFAPTIRREALRTFLAISAILGLIVHQVDIVGAYLNSLRNDKKHSIYMKQPPGINRICDSLYYRLLTTLYGSKQSGRLWIENLVAFFASIGFIQSGGVLFQRKEEEITTCKSVNTL